MHQDVPPIPPGRRAGARERLAARRRRARAIRRRVAGMSLATFAAASGAVVVQMVTGGDPALARGTSARTPAAMTSPREPTGAASPASTATASARAVAPSPVTTSAS
jgi:hypothetical protein